MKTAPAAPATTAKVPSLRITLDQRPTRTRPELSNPGKVDPEFDDTLTQARSLPLKHERARGVIEHGESIEGPAPAEDSSVPPDPTRTPIDT